MSTAADGGEVGARLRALREAAGLGQRDAARRIGIDASSLNAIESGKRGVGGRIAKKLANFYGVPIDYVVSGRGMESPREGALPARIEELVRQHRTLVWEQMGVFARELFHATVAEQEGRLEAVLAEAPPETVIPLAEPSAFDARRPQQEFATPREPAVDAPTPRRKTSGDRRR